MRIKGGRLAKKRFIERERERGAEREESRERGRGKEKTKCLLLPIPREGFSSYKNGRISGLSLVLSVSSSYTQYLMP